MVQVSISGQTTKRPRLATKAPSILDMVFHVDRIILHTANITINSTGYIYYAFNVAVGRYEW